MSWRKLIVDGQEWRWKCGGQFVSIRGPDDKGVNIAITELKAIDPQIVEDHESDSRVGPQDIKDYINGNLRNEELEIDRVAVLKDVFQHGGTYAAATLLVTHKKGMLYFDVGKGQTDEENCWIALNYLKYKRNGRFYMQAYNDVVQYPKFKNSSRKPC